MQQNRHKKRQKSGVTASGMKENTTARPRSHATNENWFFKPVQYFLSYIVMPLFLIVVTPTFVMALWYTTAKCDGSFLKLYHIFLNQSPIEIVTLIRGEIIIGSSLTCSLIVAYTIWGLVMMRLLPGQYVNGPMTPNGHVPVYKDNGFLYYIVTVITFLVSLPILKSYGYSPSIVYDNFGDIIATMNILSLLVCVALYVKGTFWPSSVDHGNSFNPIFDYYWGTELYPRILGFDVKQFTNCRFGMMSWGLLVMSYAVKSYELHGFVDSMMVSTILQMLYITKFFTWEAGYLRTIDIMLDRAGFYICWGCMVYVPGLYASVSMYLVNHPVNLGPALTLVTLVVGVLSLSVNYLADMQKIKVRSSRGECMIWGRKAEVIKAKYRLESGEVRDSILLTSGWWGMSRHFHYLPEILLAFCWSLPALNENMMPYTYVIWLVILLVHRTYRDDEKCSEKYGEYWAEYRKLVPCRIIPYIF